MNPKIKSIIFFLPKIIIFALALFDFFYIHSHIPIRDFTTIVEFPAWYEKSTTDLWMLLVASISLLISRRGSYIFSLFLSGIIAGYGLFIYFYRISLLEIWRYVQELELNIWLQWEIQFFLALLIFTTTIFYIVKDEFFRQKQTF